MESLYTLGSRGAGIVDLGAHLALNLLMEDQQDRIKLMDSVSEIEMDMKAAGRLLV